MISTKAIVALVLTVLVLLAVIIAVVRHEAAPPPATPTNAAAPTPDSDYQKWASPPVQKGKIKDY